MSRTRVFELALRLQEFVLEFSQDVLCRDRALGVEPFGYLGHLIPHLLDLIGSLVGPHIQDLHLKIRRAMICIATSQAAPPVDFREVSGLESTADCSMYGPLGPL
jgi:hypothetical protein